MMTDALSQTLAPLRAKLLSHPLYQQLQTLEQMQVFLQHHVFAVWDFMSLLKALQRALTCVDLPWRPTPAPRLRRLINEIVLGEESDVTADGEATSHYELYLRAMREAGAETGPIERVVARIADGSDVTGALTEADLPESVRAFVEHTFTVATTGEVHEVAAAFTYGREDLIPDLFGELVAQLESEFPDRMATLRYYLDRHIELDGDEHGVLGREMVALLCGDDARKQREAAAAAVAALQARLALWDGILDAVTAPTRTTR